MDCYAKRISYQGLDCAELAAGGYYALISAQTGSSVLRLRDTVRGIEVFRFSESYTAEDIKAFPEVFGLPTLYLPNRFADGRLKTSDAEYLLPINEPLFHNHIHGFMHKRAHSVDLVRADGETAVVKTSFVYDESDEMFAVFPVEFKAEFTFTLSAQGLEYSLTMTNLSDVQMPVSIATHTAIKAPFLDGAEKSDMRLHIPVGERCEINERWLPTEKLLPLSSDDNEYNSGAKLPITRVICNEMFTAVQGKTEDMPLYGFTVTDKASGCKIINEVSPEYKFWIVWNNDGNGDFFCPEPMTAMIDAPNLGLPAEVSGYNELSPNESYTVWQKFYTRSGDGK